jgi:FkbM family methyltransferase
MTTRFVLGAGRRIRRYVLPLVGQPQLRAALDEIRAALSRQEAEIAALRRQGDGLERRLVEEVDRLDGYLIYHLAETGYRIGDSVRRIVRATPRVAVAGADVDSVVVGESFDIVVPAGEDVLLAALLRHGPEGLEPAVRGVLAEVTRPGDVVVDAGASVGVHAVSLAARVGPTGRVLCFEPLPRIASALRRTLMLNGYRDAEVHELALSDRAGRAQLHAVSAESTLTSLFPLASDVQSTTIDVETVPLDDILQTGARVDVVKLDIEGAEPRAWRGMARVRADNPGLTVVLEWSASHFARSGESPNDFMQEILEDGFTATVIDPATAALNPVPDDLTTLEAANLLLRRER